MSLPPLDELQWKSPEWIQTFGLHTDNVLDYFSESPFFDKTSNNQVVKMQQQFSQQKPVSGNGSGPGGNGNSPVPADRAVLWERYPVHAMLEKELRKMKGVEYVLALVREPDLWIIRKQRRDGPNDAVVLRDFYVIGSAVYQSPTVYKIMENRLLSTNYHLSNAISQLNKLVEFHPAQGASFLRVSNSASAAVSSTVASTTGHTVPGSVSLAESGPTNTSTSGATAAATSIDVDRRQEVMNMDTMDKLLLASIKANPVYI